MEERIVLPSGKNQSTIRKIRKERLINFGK